MSARVSPLRPLAGAQAAASDPRRLVWLSASAGTGKTHVLTARVIRLLIARNDPAAILCLTFTKAGAAEMAERIHGRLASWVRMPDPKLAADLKALGEDHGPEARAYARTLFARVLEATGGGIRILTIHAFCQSLLAAFPAEAGLVPGFRLIEDREAQALARSALARMLTQAEAGGDLPLLADVATLSRRMGEDKAEAFLRRCARAGEAMAAIGPAPGIEARLRRALELPSGDIEAAIAGQCGALDHGALGRLRDANRGWSGKSGAARGDAIDRWLALDPAARAAGLAELHTVWARADGDPRSTGKGQAPQVEGYPDDVGAMHAACSALLALRAKAAFAAMAAAGLRAGQAYARAYAEAKRAAAAVDFDDLIATTVALLTQDRMGEWVRYKLDQRTDHILVDEAQDTNLDQWSIVAALASEFFAGEGARDRLRTIFTVGDFKQAIFGFQGTSPDAFEQAAIAFGRRAEEASGGEEDLRIERLSLDTSFRSTPPVLALVDRLLDHLGSDALGLDHAIPPHAAAREGPGRIELWAPVSLDTQDEGDTEGEEGWLDDATRAFADQLARQVRAWLDEAPWLASRGRPLRPEDVMVLVRKRGDLASLIVARLHARGVPVAGVDRLRLDAPLAVKDLLAAARFALQPEDDLTLASLLVSPLFGLSQDELFALAFERGGTLLAALRSDPAHGGTAEALNRILNAADQITPYRFFEELLSGELDARRKLLRRLGEEARDPIEELLSAALAFEDEGMPQLQPFLDWFDRGEVQIKRDPSAPLDAVRVMTVHGAKGLQAPLVVLADATVDPDRSPVGGVDWPIEDGVTVPMPRPRADERFAPFDDLIAGAQARERQEHWRLLYVAVTRAEEWLAVGGALGPLAKGVPPQASWYAALGHAMDALGAEMLDEPLWGASRRHVGGAEAVRRPRREISLPPVATLPSWAREPAPREERPPRPLAPSSIGRDDVAEAPPSPAARDAAARGRLLHALFQRLPDCTPDRRHMAAIGWLTRSAGVDPEEAEALARDACAIIADPRFAAIFAPGALAEAPIAAVVAGEVIAGTVDRLLVAEEAVMVVDFKTGRRAPAGLAQVPAYHLDQIAAYAAALAVIFPDRPVRAGLLYTAGPVLIEVDAATLAARKPGLSAAEQRLPGGR
ncbi:double-strand break repair helicase AddA [Sphingomonas sp.]|uniref:double-strand break repair helicase AddA n=1 Tax=Sphingomonas sp. TaxID=28214 RepID=UPI003AFFAD62